MRDKRQKATKVKFKREKSLTKQSIFVEYSLLLKKHLSFAGARWQMNTTLYKKSISRNLKLNKFTFGTPRLPDLLSKHWFASSVWNFCRWVADVPPRETSPAAKSEEKRMFSQAKQLEILVTVLEDPFSMTILLLWPWFYGLTVVALMGFHCTFQQFQHKLHRRDWKIQLSNQLQTT